MRDLLFELRAADAQKQLLDETVKAFEAAIRLTTNRFEGGASPRSDVAQAQSRVAEANEGIGIAKCIADEESSPALSWGWGPNGSWSMRRRWP
jgi:hypothetical protein